MSIAQQHQDGVTLTIRAKPGSKRNRVTCDGVRLLVEVNAPAVEGKANEAVLAVVAQSVGLRPRQIQLLRGDSAREKVLLLTGITLEQVESYLKALEGAGP